MTLPSLSISKNIFLTSNETEYGSRLKCKAYGGSVNWNASADDPAVPGTVVAVLKYLGVKETTKLVVKVKMQVI